MLLLSRVARGRSGRRLLLLVHVLLRVRWLVLVLLVVIKGA